MSDSEVAWLLQHSPGCHSEYQDSAVRCDCGRDERIGSALRDALAEAECAFARLLQLARDFAKLESESAVAAQSYLKGGSRRRKILAERDAAFSALESALRAALTPPQAPNDVRSRDTLWIRALASIDSRESEKVVAAFNSLRPNPDPALGGLTPPPDKDEQIEALRRELEAALEIQVRLSDANLAIELAEAKVTIDELRERLATKLEREIAEEFEPESVTPPPGGA